MSSELEPVTASGPAAPIVQTFSDTFMETDELHFQIMSLGEAIYLYIGNEEARQDNLALGVPQTGPSTLPASGTTLLGSGSDAASQTMAQRLAKKLGQPVFVSMNLKDDPELRVFAERRALTALQQIVPAAASKGGSNPKPNTDTCATATASAAASAAVGSGARTYETFPAGDAALGEKATAMLLEAASAAIAARGKFTLALSGGSIPKLLAPSLLAACASTTNPPKLDAWHFFLADERYVPMDHADSNMGEWKARLLDHIPAALFPKYYPLDINLPLAEASKAYEAELLKVVGGGSVESGGEPPIIDVLLLGMGPDGHTASLFPDHPLVQFNGSWVAPISDSPKPPPERITLTLPCLNAARLCLFVCTGGGKAPAVKDAFSPEPSVPSGLVLATQRTHWLMDEPAAEQLKEEEAKQSEMYG